MLFRGNEGYLLLKTILIDKYKVKIGSEVVGVDKRYFRPTEVDLLIGDATKAEKKLGWVPKISAREMCAEMVAHDLLEARRASLLNESGMGKPVSTGD